MSERHPDGESIADEETFQRRLSELLQHAYESGIDVEGGWDVRTTDDGPNWGVEIYEVVS